MRRTPKRDAPPIEARQTGNELVLSESGSEEAWISATPASTVVVEDHA